MNLLRILFITLGTLSLGIGILGIIVPGLPTTVFLLITAGLYMRSSDRLYNKVMTNRYVGKYIHDFQSKKGMTRRQKIYSISMMWTMILCSSFFFVKNQWVDLTLILLGITGTIVMGFIVKTVS